VKWICQAHSLGRKNRVLRKTRRKDKKKCFAKCNARVEMGMVVVTLDKRVTALEQQLAELKLSLERSPRAKDWQRTVGMFTGDKVMQRIDETARRYREADRAKARQPQTRSKRAKR
jgi:hypothetical protein